MPNPPKNMINSTYRISPSRRAILQTTGTGIAIALAGCSSGQEQAVNVKGPKKFADIEGVSFEQDISVSWINERFIENPAKSNPVVGKDVRFQAMVLTSLKSEEERLQKANDFQWTNFEFAGDTLLGSLFKPVDWALEPVKRLTEDFYEKFELMMLVGITHSDQEFYNKYEFTPFVWATAEHDTDYHPSGTVLEVTGTIEYADQSKEWFAPGTDDAAYISISDTTKQESLRTLWPETNQGESASFTGLQHREEKQLHNFLTELSYSYENEFPQPSGGSLVTHEGLVESKNFDIEALIRDNNASILTRRQNIVVGDTAEPPVERNKGTTTTPDGKVPDDGNVSNTIAVIDVSGSMEETDTRTGEMRLQIAKESAEALINFIESGNRLGMVAFSTRAETLVSLKAISEENRSSFTEILEQLSPRSDTSISRGIRKALQQLKDAEGPKSIVLLSDGDHNEGPSVRSVLPELKSYGITVYCIGMGAVNQELLQEITTQTGGAVEFAPRPSEIRTLYQQFAVSAQERSPLKSSKVMLSEGESVTNTARVDSSCDDVQFSLSYPGSEINLSIESPDGISISEQNNSVSHRTTKTSEVWTIKSPKTGDWTYEAFGKKLDQPEEASIEVSANSPVNAQMFFSDDIYSQTGMYRIELKATIGRRRYSEGNAKFIARGVDIDIEPIEINLRDDGKGPDPVAKDGIYTGYFHPPETGTYEFSATLAGGQYDQLSRSFTRELAVKETKSTVYRPYKQRTEAGFMLLLQQYAVPAGIIGLLGLIAVWFLRMLQEDPDIDLNN